METTNVQLCRICISANVGCAQMISIFGEDSLWQKITTLADVKIEKGDTLPQQVCITCAKNAISACLFKKKCEDADNFFRQQLLIQKFESRSTAGSAVKNVQPEVDSTDQIPELSPIEIYGGSDFEDHPDQQYISGSGQINCSVIEEDDGEIKLPYGKQPFDFHSIRLMHEYMQQQLSKINGSYKTSGVGKTGIEYDAYGDDDEDPLPLMPEVEILTPLDEVVPNESHTNNTIALDGIEHPALRGYQCPDCFQVFEMKQILKAHMQSVHGTQGPVYECTNCKKTYFYKRFLEKHIRRGRCVKKRRNQTRPMQCSDCHVLFPTGHHLGWHKRTGCPSKGAKMPLQQLLKQNIVEYNNFPKRVGIRKPENALYLHNRRIHMANNKRKGRTRIKLDSKKIALAKQLILREATTTVIANELNISRTFAWRLRKSLVNGVSLHERVIETNGDECDDTVQPMAADSTEHHRQVYPFLQQAGELVPNDGMVKREKTDNDDAEEGGDNLLDAKQENIAVKEMEMQLKVRNVALQVPRDQIYTKQFPITAEKKLGTEQMTLVENCKLMEKFLQMQEQKKLANDINKIGHKNENNKNEHDDDDDNDDKVENDVDDEDDDDEGNDDDDDDNGEDDDDGDDDDDDDNDNDDDDDDGESNENNLNGKTEMTNEKSDDFRKILQTPTETLHLENPHPEQKYKLNDSIVQLKENQASSTLSKQVMQKIELAGTCNQKDPKSQLKYGLETHGRDEVCRSSISVINQYPSTVISIIHQLPVNLSIRSTPDAQKNEPETDKKLSNSSTTGPTKKPRKPNVFIDDEKYSMAKTLVAQNASTMEIARALNVSQMTAWKVRDAIVKGLPLSYRNKKECRSASNGSSVNGETTGCNETDIVDSQKSHQLLLQQKLQQEKYRQEQLLLQQHNQHEKQHQQKLLLQQQQQEQQEHLQMLERQQQHLKAQQLMQKQKQLQEQQQKQYSQVQVGRGDQSLKSQQGSSATINASSTVKFVHPRRRLKAAEREQRDKEVTREILELIREDSNIQYWKVSARLAEKGFSISPSSVCQKLKSMGIHRRWKPGDKPPMMVDMDQLKTENALSDNLTNLPNNVDEIYEQQFDMGGAHFLSAFTR